MSENEFSKAETEGLVSKIQRYFSKKRDRLD